MTDALPPGVPPDVAEAASATLGGAVAAAQELPGSLGAALIEAARTAFIEGLQLVAAISVVGTIGLAIFAAVLLRRVRSGSGPHDAPADATAPAPLAESV
jgi:DHA2 family multidrug resistance protein-like MFS transporter